MSLKTRAPGWAFRCSVDPAEKTRSNTRGDRPKTDRHPSAFKLWRCLSIICLARPVFVNSEGSDSLDTGKGEVSTGRSVTVYIEGLMVSGLSLDPTCGLVLQGSRDAQHSAEGQVRDLRAALGFLLGLVNWVVFLGPQYYSLLWGKYAQAGA